MNGHGDGRGRNMEIEMKSSIWNDATVSRRSVLQGLAAVAVVGAMSGGS